MLRKIWKKLNILELHQDKALLELEWSGQINQKDRYSFTGLL